MLLYQLTFILLKINSFVNKLIMKMKTYFFPCSLACLVVIWMIAMGIGFLYKRFIVGAKGWEQVPLLKYYREFGNLEAVST